MLLGYELCLACGYLVDDDYMEGMIKDYFVFSLFIIAICRFSSITSFLIPLSVFMLWNIRGSLTYPHDMRTRSVLSLLNGFDDTNDTVMLL